MQNTPAPNSKPRCLVTGGAGFIGSHLVDRLVRDGHEVVVIDNFYTGRRSNLAGSEGPRLTVHEADVADLERIRPLFAGIDHVFHLAAMADIVPSINHPIPYHRANVDGTISVLEAARAAGVKRFVYAASSSCYGIPDVYTTPETAPIRPMYPYALTKYVGEEYVLRREIVALAESKRTESYWVRTRVYDASGEKQVAEMLLNHASLKHSYAGYADAAQA